MAFIKPKSAYKPTRPESVLAWVFTAGAGVALAAFVLRFLFGRP